MKAFAFFRIMPLAFLIALACLLAGCGADDDDDDDNDDHQDVPGVWTRMESGTTGTLYAIWGSSGSDVFAIGRRGLVIHYDGRVWSGMESEGELSLQAIWGSGAGDVFAAGQDNSSDEDDCYFLHYDGQAWSLMEDGPFRFVTCLWGVSQDEVYAGRWEAILRYDGLSWSSMDRPTEKEYVYYNAVFGTSGDNLFAVEHSLDYTWTLHRFDGQGWTEQIQGNTDNNIHAGWCASDIDCFAAGRHVIYHYNGQSWTEMSSSEEGIFFSIWGADGSDVFVAGHDSGMRPYVCHYDGSFWSAMEIEGLEDLDDMQLSGVWGSSGSDVFAVGSGGLIFHYGG